MKTVGIVCEYNPLHLGHKKQLLRIREEYGPDTALVCAMSGNFVQRGQPAIVDKSLRAKAAILAGADLVLELPITTALSSAEGFASGGVKILSQVCDALCFGAETADKDTYYVRRKARDDEANKMYYELLGKENDGLYIQDIMRGGILSGDTRIPRNISQ